MTQAFQNRSGDFRIGIDGSTLVTEHTGRPVRVEAPYVRYILQYRSGGYLIDTSTTLPEIRIPADMSDPDALRAALGRVGPVIRQSRFLAAQRPLQAINMALLIALCFVRQPVALWAIAAWFTLVTLVSVLDNRRLSAVVPVPRLANVVNLLTLAVVWGVVLYKLL
ncbi:hypothetical protein [Flaviaesturariibacter amylovorans]|uniref:Uncharacterized protein n=1 Tax=Flaviaesturariibacter amylovorans TaxID=1084520 RepID=A0ABP8HUC5_9BACT